MLGKGSGYYLFKETVILLNVLLCSCPHSFSSCRHIISVEVICGSQQHAEGGSSGILCVTVQVEHSPLQRFTAVDPEKESKAQNLLLQEMETMQQMVRDTTA